MMRLTLSVISMVLICSSCSKSSSTVMQHHQLSPQEKELQHELLTPIHSAYSSGSLDMKGDSITEHSELLALANTTLIDGEITVYFFRMEGDLSGIEGPGTFVIQVAEERIVDTSFNFPDW